MEPKKGRSSAAKRLLLGNLDAEEVPLTDRQTSGTSSSKGLLVDVSPTTNASHLAKGNILEMKPVEQQGRKPSHPPSCVPCATESIDEDCAFDFMYTSSLSQMPRLHKRSPTSLVQVSIIVVALAVAVVITLMFTLRNKEKNRLETSGDHFYSGFTVRNAGNSASSTALTRRYVLQIVSSARRDDEDGDNLHKQGTGSSRFTSRNGDKSRRSSYGNTEGLPRSSASGTVIWWNDDGFGPRRFLFPAPGSASKRHEEGRQHDSDDVRDKKAFTASKSPPSVSSLSSNHGGGVNDFGRRERRLGWVNWKSYLMNVDRRLPEKN